MDLSGFTRNFLAEVHSNKSIFNLLGDDQVQSVSSHFEQSVQNIEARCPCRNQTGAGGFCLGHQCSE